MYLPNHAQLMSGQIVLLPNSTPGGAGTLSESTAETQPGLWTNRMSMPPHALPSSQSRDHAAANDHYTHNHQHLQPTKDTSPVSSTRGTNQNQTGSNRNFPQKPALFVINPGHISSDGPHDVNPGRSLAVSYLQRQDHNGSTLVDQTKASRYHPSTEEPKEGKQLAQHISYSGLGGHSSGAFHVVPRAKRSEGDDVKPSGSSNSGLYKPTLTIVPPPAVPVLPADGGKAEKFPASQQNACNGGMDKHGGQWLSRLQNQQYEGQRSLQRQQQPYEQLRSLQEQERQQQTCEHQRSLQQQGQQYQHQTSLQQHEQEYEHHMSLQQDIQQQQQLKHRRLQQPEQQKQQYEHERSLQQQEQQYEHQRSLQQQEQQHEHQRSLQQQKQQYEHQRSLQQQEQQYEHQQEHKYEHQLLHQDILHQQQFKHDRLQQLGQQKHQHEHQRSTQHKRNQQMISNHSETTSPFDTVNHSSQDHNSHQRHYSNDPQHYPPQQHQQQHSHLQSASPHSHLRPSAFSPTSSASLTLSQPIPEARLGTRNIPVILVSSPPPLEHNTTQTSSPHSSLLSPKSVQEASINSRANVATLLIPPFHASHRHPRSANTAPRSRPSNLSKPCPPPRPMNLSRPDPPPRPMNLSRSESPPFSCRYVDFQPIDKPQQTNLDADTPINKTPPLAPPHRISSSVQLPPISVSPEERTSPVAMISPTTPKYSSNHHNIPKASSLERPACDGQGSATLQLATSYRNSAHQEERTTSSPAVACIHPTLQKPLPYRQDSGHKPSTHPALNSYNLQLPSPHQDLLFVPPKENKPSLTPPKRISPTIQPTSHHHHHRELSRKMQVDSPEHALRTSSKPQRPISYHGDVNPLSIHERPNPPAPPARISSTKPSSHNRDMSRSLPSIAVLPQEPSLTIPPTLHSQSIAKEDLSSSSSHATSPSTNGRPSPVSRDTRHPTLATVEDLSNIRLKPIRDSCTRPRDLIASSPGEVTTGSVNYRLRPTSGKFSNIYITEKTTLPARPLSEEFDELPPPPPPHELVLSPEDLAVLAADSDRPHQHTGSSSHRLPKPQAHVPAGEPNSSQIYHQHTQLRHQPLIRPPTHQDIYRSVAGTAAPGNYDRAENSSASVLERLQTENMSNMDFDIPDDIDLSQCPGLVEINQSIPNWKRDMVEKKNQEKIEEYVKKIRKEREQEAKWKNVPEWKKKILQKKDDEEATGSSARPETKADGTKPEIRAALKKPAKKQPPLPPPKDIKEDYSSLKPKGDFISAALSIDPEELAAMPPWKRELLFKRDKIPVSFSNEFNPDEDSTADNDKTS